MTNKREKQLEDIIAHFLTPPKGIPFEIVLKAVYGVSAVPFNREQNENLLSRLADAFTNACRNVQENPIQRPRPNEVGNDMEKIVITCLNDEKLRAQTPLAANGNKKSTGYPDVFIYTQPVPIYLEIKTYAKDNSDTTQRAFYLSPSNNPKVTQEAHHLLVGFEIEKKSPELFIPVAFQLLDLYGMDCDMKAEFNSDNRRIYDDTRRLLDQRVEPESKPSF